MVIDAKDSLIYVFKLNRRLVLQWMSAGTGLFVMSLIGVSVLYNTAHQRSWVASLSLSSDQLWGYGNLLLGLIVLPMATIIVHEGIHGLAFKAFGGAPYYGVGIQHLLPYAYATAPGQRFSRNEFLVIILAPLVVINTVALVLMGIFPQLAWLGWAVVINTSGAIGDLWMAGIVYQYPSSIMVEDRREGMALYASSTVAAKVLAHPLPHRSGLNSVWSVMSWTVIIFALFTFVGSLLLIPLDLLQVPSFQMSLGNWVLLQWEQTDQEIGISSSPLAVGAISLILALLIVSLNRCLRR
ncbi:MAG: DUF3267 domain-containing protein [Leptolyngbya sp. SIO1E4]|nr:DUF3267 domain-containing protein [Leptolyngbya sp. SIO1E4]